MQFALTMGYLIYNLLKKTNSFIFFVFIEIIDLTKRVLHQYAKILDFYQELYNFCIYHLSIDLKKINLC